MDITSIGTGNLGRATTGALAGDHSVTLLGTDTAKAAAVAGELSGDVRAGRAGDPLAGDLGALATWSWDEIVRTHSGRVYRLAYRLTGNPHDADDLTQDVFVRVFRYLSTYTPGNFEGWLHRITTNLFLDQVRRRQRIRFDALAEDAGDRLAGREPTPAQVFDDRILDGDVQTALDALPPDFRAAIVLCDIEGLSYEEIAATLGITLGAVRSRIHRGRARLRAALAHRAPRSATSRSRSDFEHRPTTRTAPA
jgi:RNA polymerase sigma factor (sigma-70 family)